MVIGIIGGGASGMAAALAASENPNAEILLFERQARVGHKLQATGNGRCNLSNRNASAECYYGQDPHFAEAALGQFDVDNTLRWFGDMGLYTVSEDSGRVYPYSDQANSVVDVLRFALEKENIHVLTGTEVTKVKKTEDGFRVETAQEFYACRKLIVACGGLAGTKLGGSMSGYKLLQKMGHHCTKLRPTLVQIRSDWHGCASLKGVRANCSAQITRDGNMHSMGKGEIQFTEYGLSGPVMFEISRDVCYEKGQWVCRLNLLPEVDKATLLPMLQRKRQGNLTAEDLLTGILHNRLGRVVVKEAGIASYVPICQLEDWELEKVCDRVLDLCVPLTEPMGMDSAQVTAGGIFTSEFDPATMESKLVPGLYACGEVLDIDGDCGGFNLQWAWSSGRCAGSAAGKETV